MKSLKLEIVIPVEITLEGSRDFDFIDFKRGIGAEVDGFERSVERAVAGTADFEGGWSVGRLRIRRLP